MRQLLAFTKKELLELTRTGKLIIILIVFFMFGILNPGIAKLTPWLYDMLSQSMEDQGIIVSNVEVTALTSWAQFFKNISMQMIILVVLFAGTLTNEYQKGTLINMLTKGLPRFKVILSKTFTVVLLWTVSYFLCFGITYGYNAYYWDNSIASHLGEAVAFVYLFGLWLIALIMFASSLVNSMMGVMLITGGTVAISYIISIIPKAVKYLPTHLLDSGNICNDLAKVNEFTYAAVITGIMSIVLIGLAIVFFNKKRV
jgi:ABC-2 type transport system permease protein